MTARVQSDPIANALDSMATTTATAISDEQRRKATAAVIWRYQHDNWTASELQNVLQALGLLDTPQKDR